MIDLGVMQDSLLARMRARPGRGWKIAFAIAGAMTMMLVTLVRYTVATGIGVWGNNVPAAWAFAIINFVFWIGIGHAGTFISAILYLLEQPCPGSRTGCCRTRT